MAPHTTLGERRSRLDLPHPQHDPDGNTEVYPHCAIRSSTPYTALWESLRGTKYFKGSAGIALN